MPAENSDWYSPSIDLRSILYLLTTTYKLTKNSTKENSTYIFTFTVNKFNFAVVLEFLNVDCILVLTKEKISRKFEYLNNFFSI